MELKNSLFFKNIGYSGRLGNQMFQFAASYAIAKSLGLNLKIPIENTILPREVTLTNGEVVNYKLELFECFKLPSHFLANSLEINAKCNVNELNFGYSHRFFNVRENTNINGYFQDFRYFEKYRDELKGLFVFNDKVLVEAKKYLVKFLNIITQQI